MVTQRNVRQQVDREGSVQERSLISQRCEKTQRREKQDKEERRTRRPGRIMVGGGGGCAVHLRMPNTWRIGKDHILSAVFAGSCRGFGVETRGLAKKRRGVFVVVPAKKKELDDIEISNQTRDDKPRW